MDNTQSFRFFNRGPSPVVRLVFFSVLSLLLLFVDARYRYLESTRSALSVLVSPIQRLATLPGALWQQVGDFFITQSMQHSLMAENDEMHQQHQSDAAQLLQLQACGDLAGSVMATGRRFLYHAEHATQPDGGER